MTRDYLKIIDKLISFDSVYTHSNKNIIDYVYDLLKKHKPIIQKVKENNFWIYNLIVKVPGQSGGNSLIFAGHTDTVPADHSWRTNPFKAVHSKGKIFGLGSSDMKSAIALMIYQLLHLKHKPENDVYLILTGDEEGGGFGIKKIAQTLKIKNARVVIGESTAGEIRLGQKAVLSFKVFIQGKAGHSANVNLDDNATVNPIQQFVRIINELNLWAGRKNKVHPIYGGITFNVGKIVAGTSANVVPGQAEFEFEFRFPPLGCYQNLKKLNSEIVKTVKSAAGNGNAEIAKSFEGGFFETKREGPFVKELQEKHWRLFKKQIKFFNGKTWTEGSVYEKFGQVIVFGPGNPNQPHQSNEYVEIKTLERVNKIYQALLENKKVNNKRKEICHGKHNSAD